MVRPWTPPVAAKYPANTKMEGWWYSASGSFMYPIYNTEVVSAAEVPKTWKDLLDPKWKGKIATSPITIGGTAWMQYGYLKATFGEAYLKQFAAGEPKLFPSYSAAVLSVARGETPSAELTLAFRGRVAKAEATGDGGYDALMNAVRKAVKGFGLEIPALEDFRVRIPPGGRTEALVETLITWRLGDETFSTLGVDSDQLAAAVIATEKMLNLVAARPRRKRA